MGPEAFLNYLANNKIVSYSYIILGNMYLYFLSKIGKIKDFLSEE